ncbi:MAG: hypothetical protein ABIO70_11930 [Pseudomonadota bacterium]
MLVEDKRTERFLRHLLVALGFEKRGFRFEPAPSGKGAAEAWVLSRYPSEVKVLRAKPYQRLSVIAVRDGDRAGVTARKAQLDSALATDGLAPRGAGERIATPVPTWAIENWLLELLGHPGVNEDRGPEPGEGTTWKQVFEHDHGATEREAMREAATAWREAQGDRSGLPSLNDGHTELARLDQ